jgi:peptide/nickel transport system substrate-binding protein
MSAAGALALVLAAAGAVQAQSVLRLVPQADLKILDTVQTTNNITSNHGYMIYDTLFSLDSKLMPKPQMVERYTKSRRPTWTFKLRPGLKFHDGQPVTSRTLSRRSSASRSASRPADDDAVHQGNAAPAPTRSRSGSPFGLVRRRWPVRNGCHPREADALGDPNTAITTAIGSGPFIFVREERCRAARSSTRRIPTTSRGPIRPTALPAPSSPRSIASSGW